MANQNHLNLLKQDINAWNVWRRKSPYNRGYLYGADLSRVDLSGADLSGSDLSGAYLRETNLAGADLSGSDLSVTEFGIANLSRANLSGANLSGANLRRADLNEATLHRTNLSRATLYRTNLSKAYLSSTIFAGNDLSTTKGLTEINHRGRSYISVDSVKLPQDGSALHFLRGAGIPDEWIALYQSTIMKPIYYYSCFISYNSSDDTLARRLHADLQDHGVRCWFAPHDLRPGQLIRKGIDEAIHMQDKLLLILSEHSVESGWVSYEVETALTREIQQKREILFPIRIDDAISQSTTDWARKLWDQRHIGDFRQWTEPSHYQNVFQRLLRDLKQQA